MARPFIIGVGGAHSGSGKTTYAALLLRALGGWGAIKYTKTELYSSLVDDRETLSTEDKDTRRMLDAGAARVLWVRAPRGELEEMLPEAVARLSDLRGIVVEGNSAIEFLKPDIIIFVFGKKAEEIKESAKGVLLSADLVVSESDQSCAPQGKAEVFLKSPADTERFLSRVAEMVEKKEKIRESLKGKAIDGRISCPSARNIAEELDVPYQQVGKTADELGIKITGCELGCF
jgi:molybdopterin-guanine dinucleotide biosynthesis protein